MEILYNTSLKKLHTFAVEAKCKRLVLCSSVDDAVEYSKNIHDDGPFFILGGGSDVLFTKDFDGTIVLPLIMGKQVIQENGNRCLVKIGAGEIWDDFVLWCNGQGLWGVENLSGIPGHVGASPVQNVGAYGTEAGDCIKTVEAVRISDGTVTHFTRDDCRFSYRNSIFKNEFKNRYIITNVYFELQRQGTPRLDYKAIRETIAGKEPSLANIREAILSIRGEKLPDPARIPNGGSFFKNPVVNKEKAESVLAEYPDVPLYPLPGDLVKISAGWLIEKCGWKGRSYGNAGVFSRQALVLINPSGASGEEISNLAAAIQKDVMEKFSITLEPEVYIL